MHSITHRGPDNGNIIQIGDDVILGHRRLSIIDTSSSSNQPLTSNCGRYILVFNGEIYNYKKIAKEYDLRGLSLISDANLLLHLLVKVGVEKAIQIIDGMFSFAFYDIEEKLVVLARDLFGQKPLFYATHGKKFVAFSELKQFKDLKNIFPTSVNEAAVDEFLKYGYIASPSTILTNVHKLTPGTFAFYSLRLGKFISVNEFRKSSLTLPKKTYLKLSNDQIFDTLRSSVEMSLTADVDVSVLLSGGIDSTIVAAIAKDIGHSLTSYTIDIGDDDYTEAEIARENAKSLGLAHQTLSFTSDDACAIISNLGKTLDEPLADSSFVPLLFLAKEVSKKFKVALTGDGGDEIFVDIIDISRDIARGAVCIICRRLYMTCYEIIW